MPRIPDIFLNCAIYLYPSVQDANQGTRAGGSGFLVAVPSEMFPKEVFYGYAVTNRHIIENGRSPVVRLNATTDQFDVLDVPPERWKSHHDGEDVAICPLGLQRNTHRFSYISTESFVLQSHIGTLAIGPGDDTFLVGRFVNHEGLQKNQPSVRFGNISMMPGDPVRQENGHEQVGYLIEAHSIAGYSGSPVFLYIPPFSIRPNKPDVLDANLHMRLLGVDWGHLPDTQHVMKAGKKHPEGWATRGNSGMMGVVPAWMLLDLLNEDGFVQQRKQRDERLKQERETAGVLDAAIPESDPPSFTKEHFEAALRTVGRKTEPNEKQPD